MNLIFRKSIIALTGLFLCLFLIVHLSANALLLFPEEVAREMYNGYSTFLRENPLIKVVAYVLYLTIILHIIYALIITLQNRKAKPDKYVVNNSRENSTWTSQNMGLIGVLILIFIVVHLGQFWARIKLNMGETVGMDVHGYKDVYEVTYTVFQNIYFVVFYTLLMIPLGLHLHHGLKSAFKSLGFYHNNGLRVLSRISLIYAAVIAIGFGIIPFIVYLK
jgi:succinate dehydrogenase / fumarate reductase cytochrome b subunit